MSEELEVRSEELEFREKVIEQLSKFREELRTCNSTTYVSGAKVVMRMDLIDKAIDLLKGLEPRLVTREDFERAPAYDGVLPCWKESKSKTRRCGWVAIVYGKALQDGEMGVARYWTGVPSEEQRREEAWPEV